MADLERIRGLIYSKQWATAWTEARGCPVAREYVLEHGNIGGLRDTVFTAFGDHSGFGDGKGYGDKYGNSDDFDCNNGNISAGVISDGVGDGGQGGEYFGDGGGRSRGGGEGTDYDTSYRNGDGEGGGPSSSGLLDEIFKDLDER